MLPNTNRNEHCLARFCYLPAVTLPGLVAVGVDVTLCETTLEHVTLEYAKLSKSLRRRESLTLTTTAAEVKRGEYVTRDHWKPKENTTTRMHEATSPRALATTQLLDPGIEEQVARNARGARNVLHVRGEDGSMYDTDCHEEG